MYAALVCAPSRLQQTDNIKNDPSISGGKARRFFKR